MNNRSLLIRVAAIALLLYGGQVAFLADAEEEIAFDSQPGRIEIAIGGRPFANYVYEDEQTLRPYFANVHAPGGIRVTRMHPVEPDSEGSDHGTMHPGIWLAFGDINGADFLTQFSKIGR